MNQEWGSNFNLRSRLLAIVAVAFGAMALIAVLALVDKRASLMEDRQVKTRHLVESAYGVLVRFHSLQQDGELTENQAKRAAIETIRNMRYDDNEYFWINDLQPRMVMHPMMPQLDGKDLSDFKDPNGKRLFVAFVATVRNNGAGFVDYLWPKPGFTQPVPKTSYVKGFLPWGWVIGSGIYLDDVNRIFWDRMRWQAGIVFVSITLLGVMMLLLARRVEREIHHYATQLAKSNAELRLSAAVFEHTVEGVMITDPDGRIVAVNRAFTEITGYGEDEIAGLTGATLKSERHDEQFYASMWSVIRETGRWQGELWNRRKNGDIYPEWLNISVVKDERGRITHYVGVFSDISSMKESESKLDHLAHHDPLTGLPNRLLLNARMEHSLARAQRGNAMLAVMFLDLDHFKDINDTLGHPIGDLLLQETAQRLRDCVREQDTVTRLGGDEFTILLEDLDDSRFASTVAQKIIAALAEKFMLQGHEVFVTCSVGISIFPSDGGDITTLFKNADSALYRAKEQGRNNYQYYTEELTTRAMERLAMENSLRHALERNELVLHYQPQVDLHNGSIIGMEALLRWQHPEIGLISPNAFIPLAEETGLIIPIGEWVLRTACVQLKAWIDEGLPKIRVGVNLSSRQFNQNNLDEVVASALRDTGLPPSCLELELTERTIMHDAENTVTILNKLRALGVQISIDDFGTGYSSLSYLKRFPIDRIKIDQSFVREITSNPEDAAISQAIISLSHSLNIKTVAEGVETAEQQEFLRSRLCDEIQGFHFSHPVPQQDMCQLLKDGVKLESKHAFIQEERVLLLVDDEEGVLNAIARVLHADGYRILRATRPRAALDLLATHPVGVIISDQRMPEMNGIELLRKVRKLHPDTVRIMLTAHADQQMIAAAINEGAVFKFIFKPWGDEQLRIDVRQAFRKHDLNLRTQIGKV
ncbi:hypothetical protein SKTS_21260 [Sulfurimicrobium lacus]|uniref:Two-component system response regulator n=1 Tax=Sulfurimicrobium lacus TaxID=2715678 RepID=A0A6F8VD27_9PROT|nr:EAL domain-containing protein [Sulfurimicrobium lacus]BCB27240.1 hypothetical protein SKTS_21260 [Sulfurimicrobium lacus]